MESILNRDLKLTLEGRGSAVSLQLTPVGKRQCRFLYLMSKSATGIDDVTNGLIISRSPDRFCRSPVSEALEEDRSKSQLLNLPDRPQPLIE